MSFDFPIFDEQQPDSDLSRSENKISDDESSIMEVIVTEMEPVQEQRITIIDTESFDSLVKKEITKTMVAQAFNVEETAEIVKAQEPVQKE